ncbi:MAG: acyl-CoA dehydrogenase family protein [Betaproteobacteria bacterium]|jgi:acyl-CoA dehydrogenase|nr:acyl-CoA dehydrogenase [Betaproteobacteria bacterium]NBT69541.1 acyl-CoA dehydrogenase [Betaproteobacteria bacterium]
MKESMISGHTQGLTPELRMLQDTINRFLLNEIHPVEVSARKNDCTELPKPDVKRLQAMAKKLGLWCFETPEEYGGAGLSSFPFVVAYEAASKHTYSLPDPGCGVFGYDPPNILHSANEEQKARYIQATVDDARQWFIGLSEPTGGSDPARAIQTKAVLDGDYWVINGRKMWTSRADVAHHGIVFARTGTGRSGISAFIVDMPAEGISVRPVKVIRDHGTNEMLMENVRVHRDNMLGNEGEGFTLAQKWLVRGRLKIAAQCVGVAESALDIAIEYARQRETFGKKLASRQSIQNMLVDGYIEVKAARWLLWDAAWQDDRGEDARHAASIAKLYSSESSFRAVDSAMQVLGGMGMSREMPLEHWFRGLRVNRVVEGPSEIHRMLVARDILGADALQS